MITTQSAS